MTDSGQKRRLATILAADVVGYSKLMAADEEATLRTLDAHRQVIDRLIARHDGHVFNTAGDSVLAEFASAVEAVRCAIAIQDELRVRNAELVDARRMAFRIGINVGDVLVKDGDLLGDGVNIAARLEGIAQPGGICISGSTFEQVKNKLSIGFRDMGPQQVKNIPEPISAYSIGPAPVALEPSVGPAVQLSRRKAPFLIVGAALAAIAGLGIVYLDPWVPAPPGGFPANASTDEMRADAIQAFMTGMVIEGTRNIDSQPFKITLNADGSATYEFARSGALAGTTERITGRWRVEDYRFCLRLRMFAQGRELCPRIVKEGDTVIATARTGERLPWSLHK